MAGKIIEMSLGDVKKCQYNEAKNCLTLGQQEFSHVALCGYVKQLEVCGNLMKMRISDDINSMSISLYCNKQPEGVSTYLAAQTQKLEDKLEDSRRFFTQKNELFCQETFDAELIRLQQTFDSIAYVENLRNGDLLLITGRPIIQEGSFLFRQKDHKTLRILEDQEEYLKNWRNKIKAQ